MFIQHPNLPTGKVTTMVVSPLYDGVTADLRSLGIKLILTEKCEDLQDPVSFHPDMLCHHFGGRNILVYPYSYSLERELLEIGMLVERYKKPLTAQYPGDVALNAAQVGENLICNKKYTDERLFSSDTYKYKRIINIAQGYAKCSTLIVDETSIVTSDCQLAALWKEAGLSALLVSPGGIRLDGHDYGFIGGAGVKISPSELYFTGTLSSYKDAHLLREFLLERGITPLEGAYDRLVDVGSMIPLLEEPLGE